jgi:hypothetical protein
VNPVGFNLFQTRPTVKGEGVLKPEYLEEATQQKESDEDVEFQHETRVCDSRK